MGKLVQFESRGKGGTVPREPPATEAEILIFTGVRYERDCTPVPSKPIGQAKAKRKRV